MQAGRWRKGAHWPETASVVFVADDLGAWLVGLLADAARKKLTALVLGSDQERALRKAAAAAVVDTADELHLSAEQAGQLAMVIRRAFRKPAQDAPMAGSVTMLEALRAGVVRQLAVLDDVGEAAAGHSPTEILGIPGAVLAEKLTGHLVREIMFRGSGGGPLAPLADQLNHDLTHLQGQRVEGMLARLVTLITTASAPSAGAGGPAREVGLGRPAGAVRVSEADPRRLGVHAAIRVPGVPEEVAPEYVPRDVDAAEHGVRARVAAAAQRGGFVLLVGGSSVGKTRCAVEAVKALLPDWRLVHPAGPAEVAALTQAPPAQMVVWLDELQRYLDGEHGLTGAAARALLNTPEPVVIIGTLWPERYAAYTTLPAPDNADPHAREREVLDLAAVIRIGPVFSPAEQDRARSAAARDQRVRVALESAGYGLTQTLAAAPQLVAHWEDAQTASPYGWAVLTAALDAARLGARAPLSSDFLRAAAPGYCTSAQQAEAPGDWFEKALSYATGKLYGAAAALAPSGTGMGRVAGYTSADYLIQHASRERRYARVPASTWAALLSHVHDPADATRLADSARGRLLYCYATPLYQLAADAGYQEAAARMADFLAERGDLDELRAQADAGDPHAAYWLAEALDRRGGLDELHARAGAGDPAAADRLAEVLARREDLDELRTRANAGDPYAADWLAETLRARADNGDLEAEEQLTGLLTKRGWMDELRQILRARADSGDPYAASRLASFLAERGNLDELHARADAGDLHAADRLADLEAGREDVNELYAFLARRKDLDTLRQILRAWADADDPEGAYRLARLLAERGDLDELRARADAGDPHAAYWLAEALVRREDLDELRTRANAGDPEAAYRLADLLAKRGDLDQAGQILRALTDSGAGSAGQLAKLLAEQGRGKEAENLRRFGLNPDGSIARR